MNRGAAFWTALAALGLGMAGLFCSLPASPAPQKEQPIPMLPGSFSGPVIVLALVAAGLAFHKKTKEKTGRSIKVLSAVPISQNQRLVTVKFGGRVLLLGQTSSQISMLADTSNPEEIRQLEPETAGEEAGAPGTGLTGGAWAERLRAIAFRALPVAFCLLFAASAAHAQQLPAAINSLGFEAAHSPQQAVGSLQVLILMSVLAFVPALILMMTSFTRILIVLSLLRQAIGLPQIPPNQIVVALSLFLTLFVMRPQISAISDSALDPYLKGSIPYTEAFKRAEPPLRSFMMAQVRLKDLQTFAAMSGVTDAAQVPLTVLIPAYVTSELKTAFQIGFLLFIPFLLVDMIVASILMSMGMVMIPPAMISMPFKLLLFVLIDGWNLVLTGLVHSFK